MLAKCGLPRNCRQVACGELRFAVARPPEPIREVVDFSGHEYFAKKRRRNLRSRAVSPTLLVTDRPGPLALKRAPLPLARARLRNVDCQELVCGVLVIADNRVRRTEVLRGTLSGNPRQKLLLWRGRSPICAVGEQGSPAPAGVPARQAGVPAPRGGARFLTLVTDSPGPPALKRAPRPLANRRGSEPEYQPAGAGGSAADLGSAPLGGVQ